MIIALQTLIFFRESLFTIFNRYVQPYYKRFALVKANNSDDSDEEEDVHVYSDYDDEKGVIFFPPVYAQRYAAVSDCLLDERWSGKIEKVVDLGYNDISFIKYLKEVPGVKQILGVDLECIPLRCSSGLFVGEDYIPKRENPLRVTLFQGNAADPDFRLIGTDAVVAIEMIEHMLPHDLERLVHTVFGFIKPWVAIFTTPNADFNVLFKALEANGLRRLDHLFEWSREQFHDWCSNIVNRYPEYTVNCRGIGPGPPGTKHLGCCSQMAVFVCADYQKQMDLDPQSMAMITNVPNADNLVVAANWENQSSVVSEKVMLCNRLNCTTFQVKKFSKATQNLMAMNKIDSLAHTREVVDEIKRLTNMLNFKPLAIKSTADHETIWRNTNWGDNAPYWNQYYKVVRDYNYPFESKSDDCRVLELISDEINRLIDIQYDNVYGENINKLEIPMTHLMQLVQHITEDQDKVKDLLEWNGYEVAGDVVVYSRMVLDNLSSVTFDDEWREDDTVSDWDADLKTTSISDETSTLQEMSGRSLRRALDYKVRKLRSMMTADEDITSELDKVVCRLMKLTLKTSRGRRNPPPTKWLQCKLFDLLTLTEKAVERRRRYFSLQFPVQAISYGEDTLSVLNKIKADSTGLDLVRKYSHLVQQKPDLTEGEYFPMEIDDITVYSNFKDIEVFDHSKMAPPTKTNLERTQAWVEEELKLVKYTKHTRHGRTKSTTETDSVSYNEYNKYKQPKLHRVTPKTNLNNITTYVDKKISSRQKLKTDDNIKYPKKVLCKKTSSYLRCSIRKNPRKREIKEHKQFQLTISKPIPGSLIELCTQDIHINKTTEKSTPLCSHILKKQEEVVVAQMTENGINNEESYLGDIVMDGDGETSLLHGVSHHTTGTDVETDKKQSEKNTILGSVINAFNETSVELRKSQTIFLNDINEPSTSKGVRHICMDAQCGPDDDSECLAPTPSPLDLNVSSEDKSKHSLNNMLVDSKKSTVGSSINDNENNNISSTLPRTMSVGIKIKDSDTQIHVQENDTKITEPETVDNNVSKNSSEAVGLTSQTEEQVQVVYQNPTETLQPVRSNDIDIASIIISRLKLCYAGLNVRSYKYEHTSKEISHKDIQKPKPKLDGIKKPMRDLPTKSNPIKSSLKNVENIQHKREVLTDTGHLPNTFFNIESSNKCKKSPINSVKLQNVSQKITNQDGPKKTQIRNPKLTIIKKRSDTRMNINDKGVKNAFHYRSISSSANVKKVASKKHLSCVLIKNDPGIIKIMNNPISNSKNKNTTKKIPQNYLPTYLRRRLAITEKDKTKLESKTRMSRIDMAKNEDIKNFSNLPAEHLSQFLVYRNETKMSTKEEESSDRSTSPVSVASSTCSSPTSIITIKVRPCSNPKLNNDAGSKSATSIKSKKTAKGRSGKINNKDDKDDKENEPGLLCSENTYVASSPTVFMTKLSNTPLHPTENTATKQRKPFIPDIESAVDKQGSVEVIKKKSAKFNTEEIVETQNKESKDQIGLKTDLACDMNNLKNDWDEFSSEYPRTSTPVREIESKELNNRLLSDLLELNDEPSSDSFNPVSMTELIVDMLDTIDITSGMPQDLDSRTVILSQEDLREENFEEENNVSIESAKTVVDTLQNIVECDEQEEDNSYDTVVANEISGDLTYTGVEVLSFQTCTTTSKVSDTLQNAEDNDGGEFHTLNSQSNLDSSHCASRGSVLDLFERKDILPCPANIGPLAIQAFSGFSVNNPPTIGDQPPDYISLFDSETGSPAMGVSRQAESEEMFLSGRSSVTYVSCSMDEDATVPAWLFRIINQPLHVQDEGLDAIAVSLPEPHYDTNGNVVDTLVGTDAGAGDGRGVHSDVSQDSSGQGSSLSSSDASSGPLSEAVLIDPSMLTSQFGIPPPPIPLNFNSAVSSPMDLAEAGEIPDPPARSSRDIHCEPGGPLLGASDADADESSLDTDAD